MKRIKKGRAVGSHVLMSIPTKPAYRRAKSLLMKDWLFLLVFSLIYIILAIIMLSFVDKDER